MTPTNQLNEQYEDGGDMKKVDMRATVAEITIETVLDTQKRAKAERALVQKLDVRLLPMIVLVFIMNYIGMAVALKSKFSFSL